MLSHKKGGIALKPTYPWSNEKNSYPCFPAKEKSPYVLYMGQIFASIFIIIGILTPSPLSIAIGALLLLAATLNKQMKISSKGLEISYNMHVIHHYDCWPWSQVDSLTYADDPNDTERKILYFTQDIKTKKVYIPKQHLADILDLARKNSLSIKIYNGNAYRNP